MKILMLLLMVCILLACNSQEEIPDGGPCTYDSTVNSAKLINLVQKDSSNYDAQFEISWKKMAASDVKDTFSFYMENHRYLTIDQIKNDSLAVGNTYSYIEYFIRSGSCNGYIKRLVLTPLSSSQP